MRARRGLGGAAGGFAAAVSTGGGGKGGGGVSGGGGGMKIIDIEEVPANVGGKVSAANSGAMLCNGKPGHFGRYFPVCGHPLSSPIEIPAEAGERCTRSIESHRLSGGGMGLDIEGRR